MISRPFIHRPILATVVSLVIVLVGVSSLRLLPVEQYPSVGCKPCTRAVMPGEDHRAGRWAGKGKTECGLHTDLFNKKTLSSDDFNLNIRK